MRAFTPPLMSLHSYSRVWLHAIWGTLERRPMLTKTSAVQVSGFLGQYSSEKGIYMKLNYVNSDHVHVLVDLPTNLAIEELMHLLKGASSHWINENNLSPLKFAWGKSTIGRAASRKKSGPWFSDMGSSGIRKPKPLETVSAISRRPYTPLKRGVNGSRKEEVLSRSGPTQVSTRPAWRLCVKNAFHRFD